MKIGRRAFCLSGAVVLAAGSRLGAATPAIEPRGLYADDEGRFAAIGRFEEFGPGDYLFDYAGNHAGRLAPAEGATLDLLSTFTATGEPIARLAVEHAELTLDGRRYRKLPIRRRPFTVPSAGIELHGEIARREDLDPRGAIVLIYGSGPAPKEALDLWAFHFLAHGWVVGTYDKRGSGRSGGDWRLAGLETLAEDAAAVIGQLRPEIAAGLPLGVWGASQGGWIAPQLGARRLVDFIILHAAAAVTPGEQILQQVAAELAAYGMPADEIAAASAYYALDTDVSRGRRPWSEIEAAHRSASEAGAEWLLGPPAAADAPEREMIRLMADFDPAPSWRGSEAPVLAIFGGKDVIVPPEPNATRLRELVPEAVPLTVRLLPEANHLGFVADTGVRAEYAARTRIDPGYFEAIDQWADGAGRGGRS